MKKKNRWLWIAALLVILYFFWSQISSAVSGLFSKIGSLGAGSSGSGSGSSSSSGT